MTTPIDGKAIDTGFQIDLGPMGASGRGTPARGLLNATSLRATQVCPILVNVNLFISSKSQCPSGI